MEPLKLAINAVQLAPGGGLVGLTGYLEAWKELDVPLEVTVYASRQTVIDAVVDMCLDVEIVPFALNEKPWKHFFLQQTRLGGLIDKGGFEVLMTTQYGLRNCRTPQLIHHQNLKRFMLSSVYYRLKRGQLSDAIKDYAARTSMSYAECNVFISEFMKEEAEKIVHGSIEQNFVVYNGLSRDLLNKKQKSASLKANKKADLMAIQDTSEHKDNKTLINTLSVLCSRRPDVNWHLHIAGAGDWVSVKSYAHNLNVSDRISFYGYLSRDQIFGLLKDVLCLVFTSRLEGFGNPPLEAMATGCPVLACNCTAMPEVIGEAGILVDPGNHREFASSIIGLYDDNNLRNSFITKGLTRCKMFNWNISAMKMYELLVGIATGSDLIGIHKKYDKRAEKFS